MDIEVLVDFLNSFDGEELATDTAARAWFRARGLPTTGLRAEEARRVRDALRACSSGDCRAPGDLALVPLRVVPAADGGLDLVSDSPLGPLVGAAVRLAFEGNWDRLKLCGLDSCRYAFFDESKNRSARWCSMATCGNRAKSRAFRERHRHG